MKSLTNIWTLIALAGIAFIPANGSSQVVLGPGTSMTIQSGGSLFVDTTLAILSNDSVSGHLCDQNPAGNVQITGSVTVERYLTASMWHNCATPVSNNQTDVFTGTDLIFYYDETIIENDWEFGWVFYDGQLEVMKGYDIFLTSPITVAYTATSSEELNTGGYTMNVTRTDPANGEIENHKGWNLIGNPYPSPVDWLEETGWDKTSINDAKYIWDHQNLNYTIFIGGDNPLGINGGTRYIPANQGFWVQAVANGTVQVNNNARRGIMDNTPGFYKTGEIGYPMLCLRLEADKRYDETVIRFLDEASVSFDPGLDAFALNGRAAGVPSIRTICIGNQMAINSLPTINRNMVFDLQTMTGSGTPVNLRMTGESTLEEYAGIYIKDLLTDQIINLKSNPSYHFTGNAADGNHRFLLYINPPEDVKNNVSAENAFTIYSSGRMIFVQKNTSVPQHGEIYIFSIFGNIIDRISLPDQKQFQFYAEYPSGYYIVRVVTEKNQIAEKIHIN